MCEEMTDEEVEEVVEIEEFTDEESWLWKTFKDEEKRDFLSDTFVNWTIGLNGGEESYDPEIGEDGAYYNT